MITDKDVYEYSALQAYNDYSVAQEYEKIRFSGWLGNYRWRREQKAIGDMIKELPNKITICDIPCGTGRFWNLLSSRASKIIAMDISDGMIRYAGERAKEQTLNITIERGDATNIPLDDNSVDYVFSYALTKHLPIPMQYKALREFSRVSRLGVICSFGIFSHLTYEIWRHRSLLESYPVFYEELKWMAKFSRLGIVKKKKCSTIIGVEHIVFFKKLD
jgi:ubiquinone/menaquinone biosynthesis C-methylase UbiE